MITSVDINDKDENNAMRMKYKQLDKNGQTNNWTIMIGSKNEKAKTGDE